MSQEEAKTPAASTSKKAEEKKNEVGQMKKGDYMIHVFIETVRQLKCGEEGSNLQPIVEVECIKDKKYTSSKDGIGPQSVVHWNEHLFFEPKNLSQADIEQAKISLRVMDKGLLKNSLVGMFEFDVAFIYFMEKHTMFHKWIVLSDPNSPNFDEVTGYMKLSISVAAGGDEQIQITEDVSGNEAEQAMMPPSIKPQFYQLKFRFFKAEKLPIMDMQIFGKGGSIDAYVKMQYMKKTLKTKTYTMKNEVVFWDQEFLIPQSLPIMTGRIKMELWDEDKVSDEMVGSMLFNAKEILGALNGRFFWKNIYGAPLDVSGENTKIMNNNPDLASTWKGRILMQCVAEQAEKPMISCFDLSDEIKDSALPHMEDHEYEILLEVGLGISLPAEKKYTVKVKIADFELKTDKPAAAEATYNRWNKRFPVTVYTCPYQDVYDIGTVFIYLMDGDKPICYARDHISNFLDPNAQLKWYEMLPDLSLGKVKEHHKAGIVSIKMSVNDKTKNGALDFTKFAAWKKPPPKRPMNKKVRAYLFQCRDLPAADDDGSSDPYVCIWDTSKTLQKTKYIEDNVNPLFYTTLELMYEANSSNIVDMPPFVIDIYDKDFGLDGDDFLCRAIINIEDAALVEGDEVPTPKWHTCRLKQGAPGSGEVLMAFSIVDDDFNFKVPLPYMSLTNFVKFDEFTVELNVLGLRDLQSVGIMPVKKAYIQFNLKSLLPPENALAIDNIQTQPGPAGADPTINTLIKFSCPLPTDPLYCPRLACIVYDNIFKGFMQPLLGTFTIPIGDILQQKLQQRSAERDLFEFLCIELQKIIDDEGIVSYNVTEQASAVDDEEFRASQAEAKAELEQQFNYDSINKDKEPTPYDEIETKRVDSMKQPLLNMDYLSDDEENEKRASKVSPTKEEEKTFNPSVSQSPTKSPDNIMQNSEIKESWFRRVWNVVIRKNIREKMAEKLRLSRLEWAQREMDAEQMKRDNANLAFRTIVRAEYALDERLNVHKEINIPPDTLYIGLGFDEDPEQKRKHYRKFYPDELEFVKDVMPTPSPFDEYAIKRGQARGASKSFFSFKAKEDESGATTTEKVVGKFKGLINIISENDRAMQEESRNEFLEQISKMLNKVSYKRTRKPMDFKIENLDTHQGRMKFRVDLENLGLQHLNIHSHLQKLTFEDSLKRMLMASTSCIIRLYVISAFDLASRDIGSASDPYLYITLGDKKYNDRKNYQDDEPNPDFFKMFEFEATFPGCPMLNLAIYDYDDLFGDDLIGETKIDLEDRFFSPEWQALLHKPVEYRQLYHQSSSCSQGQVKCWVEIVDKNDAEREVFDIRPKPPDVFEVRVCVFDTIDVKAMDDDGCSDVFIKAFFNQKDGIKETDTHFRCQDGSASFNYRMCFNFEHPKKLKSNYELTIQAFDRDFFKSNDIIGEAKINLFHLIEDCALTQRPISLNQKYYDYFLKQKGITVKFKDENSFYLEIMGSGFNKKGKREITGKIRIQMNVYPKDQAILNKVGEARQEPNVSPYLPPPIGRLSFSMNPFKMFTQLVGPRLRRKIYCYCCIIMCCAMCLTMFPLIISQIMSDLLNPFN